MSPEQITERVEKIADALHVAIEQIESLDKAMTGSIVLEDIRLDLQLAKSSRDIQGIYSRLLTTLGNDLPEHFERMRTGVA